MRWWEWFGREAQRGQPTKTNWTKSAQHAHIHNAYTDACTTSLSVIYWALGQLVNWMHTDFCDREFTTPCLKQSADGPQRLRQSDLLYNRSEEVCTWAVGPKCNVNPCNYALKLHLLTYLLTCILPCAFTSFFEPRFNSTDRWELCSSDISNQPRSTSFTAYKYVQKQR